MEDDPNRNRSRQLMPSYRKPLRVGTRCLVYGLIVLMALASPGPSGDKVSVAPQLAEYALPDGSVPPVCDAAHGERDGERFCRQGCDHCVVSAAAAPPPPARFAQFVTYAAAPNPVVAVSDQQTRRPPLEARRSAPPRASPSV